MFIENLLFVVTSRRAGSAYKKLSCVPITPRRFMCIISFNSHSRSLKYRDCHHLLCRM